MMLTGLALLATMMLQTPPSAAPQQTSQKLKIVVLNGKTGKPIQNSRLLIFQGETSDEVKQHARDSTDLFTNDKGIAILPIQSTISDVQVWVDFMTQCEKSPNAATLNIPAALEHGVISENSCGSIKVSAEPGKIVVFARKPTLRERMAW